MKLAPLFLVLAASCARLEPPPPRAIAVAPAATPEPAPAAVTPPAIHAGSDAGQAPERSVRFEYAIRSGAPPPGSAFGRCRDGAAHVAVFGALVLAFVDDMNCERVDRKTYDCTVTWRSRNATTAIAGRYRFVRGSEKWSAQRLGRLVALDARPLAPGDPPVSAVPDRSAA